MSLTSLVSLTLQANVVHWITQDPDGEDHSVIASSLNEILNPSDERGKHIFKATSKTLTI